MSYDLGYGAGPCGGEPFRQRLQQNGICRVSRFPLYLASMEELSEAYVLRTGKRERNELSSGALFACQMEVVKRICEVGPRLVTIPDIWLLDFDMMGKFAQNVSPTANDTAL